MLHRILYPGSGSARTMVESKKKVILAKFCILCKMNPLTVSSLGPLSPKLGLGAEYLGQKRGGYSKNIQTNTTTCAATSLIVLPAP